MKEIMERRSVRRFTDAKVEPEKVERLLRAAMCAPTAGNQREWEFIVIDDPALGEKAAKTSPYAGCAEKAPLLILPVSNSDGMKFPQYWQQDLGAAVQNILTEAVHLGLGAVWLGIAPEKDRMDAVAELFALPENVQAFAIIALGYPLSEASASDRYVPEKVHYNGY